jgi:Na+/proline symporter
MIAAIFWRGSTKWGALASTVWVACAVAAVALFQQTVPAPAPGPPLVVWSLGGTDILARTPAGTSVYGFMPVVPMVLVSALLMVVVSLVTSKPRRETIEKYFSKT